MSRRLLVATLVAIILSKYQQLLVESFLLQSPTTARHTNGPLQSQEAWNGQVVPDERIRGCQIENVGLTEWIVSIDGVEADLGAFSQAVYRKISGDAKRQRFQGFRPGTIPPHLEPTYRGFCMDECARETVLEALEQNSIRPFERCRLDMQIEEVSIPPVVRRKKSKKKKSKDESVVDQGEQEAPAWRTFQTMKEAISAGWKPGQSFSFRASKVKGQKLETETGQTVGLFGNEN